jgi:single-stranded-DNA-specific exonuclease
MSSSYWHIKEFDSKKVDEVAKEFKLPYSIAKIMSLRGIIDREISSNFFYPDKSKLHDPYLLKDMDKAVKAIINHRDNGNKLMIFGDYDVDGVSSTAMLSLFFKSINMDVSYYIPHRDIDGYGLSKRGIDFANSIGSTLIITCDCGINAFDQIEYAMGMGIDVIVTDHHKPEEKIPNCIAVINPNREDCSYPFNGLCGAGVAFKLAFAIADTISVDLDMVWKYADIVTLGIAADIVPMVDENRIISYFGLKQIKEGNNLGIRSLIETSKLQIDRIGIGQITFWVTPKINAAGRLGEATRAVKLLSSNNQVNAMEIAKALDKENEKRKLITLNMENESLSMIENDPEFNKKSGIVLYKENWHSGVIGIVASRIKEIYNKPTVIIGLENKIGKGSCRSISQLDIVEALNYCSSTLDGYGGHPMAAGLTIKGNNVDEFKKLFESYCGSNLKESDLVPTINIDAEIQLSEVNGRMINFLKYLEPYGPKNSKPIFLSTNIKVQGMPKVLGKDQSTLKFKVKQDQSIYEAIGFRMIDEYEKLIVGGPIDIAYNISENHWNGKTSLQLEIKAIRYSNVKD